MYDNRPGIQSYVDGGEAIFDFKPSGRVGTHRILVESVFGLVETDIQFTADLSRPPVMVGYIEGAVKLGDKNIDLEGLLTEDKLNAFEETTQGLNGALFLKGKIKGDALLTLRYDSDRDTNERLFRDVEPDRFYPVYGDTSERGFDAQSRGEIFVKIEKRRILYSVWGCSLWRSIRCVPSWRLSTLARRGKSASGKRPG